MEVTHLYDSLIKNANLAKSNFVEGKHEESFGNLNEIKECIALLNRFRHDCNNQQYLPLILNQQKTRYVPKTNADQCNNELKREFNSDENTLKINNNQPKVHIQITKKQKHKQIQRPPYQDFDLDPNIKDRVNTKFYEYLTYICSNPNVTDSRGEKIHQTLRGKKLEKVDHTDDFITIRFRIQSFQNGFEEFLKKDDTKDQDLKEILPRQIKNYLFEQQIISRYNEDGRKSKSKGNHVWNLKAKKVSSDYWQFQPFYRRISNFPMPKAIYNKYYSWSPWVWDPQMRAPRVVFHSTWLPSWLRWEGNKLCGTPPKDATDCQITVIAECIQGNEAYKLEATGQLQITHFDETTQLLNMGKSGKNIINNVAKNKLINFQNKNIEAKEEKTQKSMRQNNNELLEQATTSISNRLLGTNGTMDNAYDYKINF